MIVKRATHIAQQLKFRLLRLTTFPKSVPEPAATITTTSLQRDIDAYRTRSRQLIQTGQVENPHEYAIGASSSDEFQWSGKMEVDALIQFGLRDGHYLLDIGCGSGRLASSLLGRFNGRYLGTDISLDLLHFANQLVQDSTFEFAHVGGLSIPTPDNCADMICFFSVLTHLRHEESFLYLKEAKRVLKPGGKIVLSFLDFLVPSHWVAFESVVNELSNSRQYVVNQLIDRHSLETWASHLGLDVVTIHNGDEPHIINTEPRLVHHEADLVTLGQSLCVLEVPRS